MSEEPNLREEIHRMQREPLLPIEKRLIIWSLAVGVVLLGVLVWISGCLFPATGSP